MDTELHGNIAVQQSVYRCRGARFSTPGVRMMDIFSIEVEPQNGETNKKCEQPVVVLGTTRGLVEQPTVMSVDDNIGFPLFVFVAMLMD